MAEKYSPEKAAEGFKDTAALMLVASLAVFAFIAFFVSAPLRR